MITDQIKAQISSLMNAMEFKDKGSEEYHNMCESLLHLMGALKLSQQIDEFGRHSDF